MTATADADSPGDASSSTPARAVSLQGHFAGGVSRLAAYVVDQFTLAVSYGLGVAGIVYAVNLVTRQDLSLDLPPVVTIVTFSAWWLLYFGYSWSLGGRSFGMGVMGLRVVDRSGEHLAAWRAFLRAAALPLSFLLAGLGFLGILVGRERRALHDVIAHSAVVYDWDARAAQLRFLARANPSSRD